MTISVRPTSNMVMGVGGAGCNLLNEFSKNKISNFFEMVAVNTDDQALERYAHLKTLKIGFSGQPAIRADLGRKAALFSQKSIQAAFDGTTHLYLLSGLGGGTSSGAVPVIAKIALDFGIIVHVLASTPWEWESLERHQQTKVSIALLDELQCSLQLVHVAEIRSSLPSGSTFNEAIVAINNAILSKIQF